MKHKKIWPQGSAKRTPVSILKVRGQEAPNEFPNNLCRYQWRHELPDDPDGDAELVRLARLGDRKAAAEIVRNFHRVVIGRAGRHWRINYQSFKRRKEHTNGARDDFIGRGFLALWRAVLSWNPDKHGPFRGYAAACIGGQISNEASLFIKRGSVGETRIERWLFSHPNATPEELSAAFEKNGTYICRSDAENEIARFKARCNWNRYVAPDEDDDEARTMGRQARAPGAE